MTLDLNDAQKYAPLVSANYNRDQISFALRLLAPLWVPAIFKKGRLVGEAGKRSIRCSDIRGNPPKQRGSCRIWITGENAGDWCDFEDKDNLKGGPISTIKEHFNLEDGEAFEKCLEIIAHYGGEDYLETHPGLLRDQPKIAAPEASNKSSIQIDFFMSQRRPAAGSPVENYFASRLAMSLPPCAYSSPDGEPDIWFVPLATNYKVNRGFHSMLSRFRYPDGTPTGAIHMTHLLEDGSHHIGKFPDHPEYADHSKIVWGARKSGGVVMLAPIAADGALGIGEGIETTAAGCAYFGCGGWAAGDTASMVKTGEWLAANPSAPITLAIKRLLIFVDKGRGGEAAAQRLAGLAQSAGIASVELFYPSSGDDLAADRAAGYPAPAPIIDHWQVEPGLPIGDNVAIGGVATGQRFTEADLGSRLMAMSRETPGAERVQFLRDVAASGLGPLAEDSLLTQFGRKVGAAKKLLSRALIDAKGEITPPEQPGSAKGQSQPWRNKMAFTETGDPKGIMSNVAILLRECNETKNSLGYNEFAGEITVFKKLPWERGAGTPCEDRPWTDADELAMTEWVQSFAGVHAPRNAIFDAVCRVANEFQFNPVRQMLDDAFTNWDRGERLNYGAVRYFGATDIEYHREVFKRWLLSAVARIYRPGCKADNMTVFEGPQGLRKSTAVRVLFDPWFTDHLSEMGTRDSSLELRGIWCAEYSDLEGMNNTESKRIKSFMSRTNDRFRAPYGHVPINLRRQIVFAGTTNEITYLKDATGARRFWPLRCGYIDIDALARDRDNLWGETVGLFRQKIQNWWIDQKTEPELARAAEEMTNARYQSDAWEEIIIGWLRHNGRVNCTTSELMRDALEIHDKSKWQQRDLQRIGNVMKRVKWIRARDRGGSRDWRYWRPDAINHDLVEV